MQDSKKEKGKARRQISTMLVINQSRKQARNIIGANRPRTSGTVPDLEPLSRVTPGNDNLPGLSQNSKDP